MMKETFPLRLLRGIAFVLIFSFVMNGSTSAGFGKLSSSPPASNSSQEAMLERGNVAMGFDQNKIMHHFMSTSTGGKIMIIALDGNDSETIVQINQHVIDIQEEFSQGNFTKPFFIHDQQVPGTDVMAEKKDLIRYSTQQLDNGAVLVLTTDDKELLNAIQQFMNFQGKEHMGH
jgi:hypothetical protein